MTVQVNGINNQSHYFLFNSTFEGKLFNKYIFTQKRLKADDYSIVRECLVDTCSDMIADKRDSCMEKCTNEYFKGKYNTIEQG